ncbi:MAG: peptidoglycan DD-metalloendopeptidase family protein [Gemmatimonadota bacterium]|nr:peptidoglycan DD-metalloendopeptidase family protein [Gemmatimonadota bacterium]
MIVTVLTVAVVGACTNDGEQQSAQVEVADSTAASLAHVNGAVLDSAPRSASPPARTAVANGSSSNGSTAAPAGSAETSGGNAVRAVDTTHAITTPNPTPNTAGPAGVAPTPDELSALAASLVVPVAGVMPSELRSDFHAPRGGGARRHNALDIPAPRGTPVISATSGRVLRLFNSKAGGIMVYAADATERFILMYGHLDRYAAGMTDGMRLERGQTIGYVGTTGNAPPNVPHLHFAIARTSNVSRWWNGTPIDPAPLFKR